MQTETHLPSGSTAGNTLGAANPTAFSAETVLVVMVVVLVHDVHDI